MTESEETDHVRQLGEGEHVSEAVLQAIAAVSTRSILELPPLQDSVETDSLDRLFESSTAIRSLRFEYAGYDVTIESERVRVRQRG